MSGTGLVPTIAPDGGDRLNDKVFEVRGQPASVVDLLNGMIALKASEMFLKPGVGVRFKVGGKVKKVPSAALTGDQLRWVVRCFLGDEELATFAERRVADVVHETDKSRYRVHFAYGHTGPYATIRIIGQEIYGFERLGLPVAIMQRMVEMRGGLFIVCGTTDAGKTVTCTSFIEQLNQLREHAMLTLEDPIEYIFQDKKSWILQREVGTHVESFAAGIKSALRENLDVVFVGEMRETSTIEQVLRAAEMGHLVISTMHADDAISALNRVIGSFPQADQPRIRQSLSGTLNGVLYQRLLPGARGGRIPCVESIWPNHGMRNNLRSGELSKLMTYVGPQTGVLYRDHLALLTREGKISQQTAEEEMARLRAAG